MTMSQIKAKLAALRSKVRELKAHGECRCSRSAQSGVGKFGFAFASSPQPKPNAGPATCGGSLAESACIGIHELGSRWLSPRFRSVNGGAARDFESRRLNLTPEPLRAGRHFCLNRTSQVASAFRNSLVPSPAGCQLPTRVFHIEDDCGSEQKQSSIGHDPVPI